MWPMDLLFELKLNFFYMICVPLKLTLKNGDPLPTVMKKIAFQKRPTDDVFH